MIVQGFTLASVGFTLWAVACLINTVERYFMSTQDLVDAIVVQLGKAKDEVVAKIADVQAQLDAASVPADVVNLDALTAAAQALDDIVPDEPPVS